MLSAGWVFHCFCFVGCHEHDRRVSLEMTTCFAPFTATKVTYSMRAAIIRWKQQLLITTLMKKVV